MDTFKIFIKKTREKLNLTQQGFAEKVGVTKGTVYIWEQGNNMPNISDIELLKELSKISNTSVSEIRRTMVAQADLNDCDNCENSYKNFMIDDEKIMGLAQDIAKNTLEKLIIYSLIDCVACDESRPETNKRLGAVMEILEGCDAKKIRMMMDRIPSSYPFKKYWNATAERLGENDLNKVLLDCYISLYEYSETHNRSKTISELIKCS